MKNFLMTIITGTLNRKNYLTNLVDSIQNHKEIQLVIVDGGSNDGTVEYLSNLKNPQVKSIFYKKRSSYPHFMNLAIRNADSDYICQFNDDALFVTDFNVVLNSLQKDKVIVFNWKVGTEQDLTRESWLKGNDNTDNWCIHTSWQENNIECSCMNYGIYDKKIFENIGMYYQKYNYYYCDGDMTTRALHFGYEIVAEKDIKIIIPNIEKKAILYKSDEILFHKMIKLYSQKMLPSDLDYL